MPRNYPAQDRYSPSSISITDFENHRFSEIEPDDLLWLNQNPNGDVNHVHRKINENQAMNLKTREVITFESRTVIYQKV